MTSTKTDDMATTSTVVGKTPPRHNYANTNTPIASIKRPRSSLSAQQTTSLTSPPPAGTIRRSNSLQSDSKTVRMAPATPANTTTPAANNHRSDAAPPRTPMVCGNGTPGVPSSARSTALSPMHPPTAVHRNESDGVATVEKIEGAKEEESWVGRQVDAIFSPVLTFLQSAESEAGAATVTDEDVPMDEHQQDSPTTSSSTASSATTGPRGQIVVLRKDGLDEDREDSSIILHKLPAKVDADADDGASSTCESLQESMAAVEDCLQENEFNPWQFIKSLPSYDLVRHLCPNVALPPKDPAMPPITLVLDLDETLVHCTVETIPDADLTFPVQFHGMTYTVHVKFRPHLQDFLQRIQNKFEIVVFTASQKVYANELLNLIDPEGKYIHHRLFRESCLAVDGNFLKDLNVLGRDLSKTVLVDNSPHAFGYQADNGVPIESWFDDANDKELLKLEKFLRGLHTTADVRDAIRSKFQCHKLIEAAAPLA